MPIRIAGSDDKDAVDSLYGRCYPRLMAAAYAPEVLAVALPVMTRANPALLESGTFYLAKDTEDLIGCGGWTWNAPGSGDIQDGLVHARHFATDPDHAGRGVGRALFERCARDALAAGARRIQAFSSLNAEPFYARMGLVRVKVIEVPMGNGVAFPAVLMEGALDHRDP